MIGMKEHPFFRCETCGHLVDDDLISQGACTGHKMKYAGSGTFFEWLWMEKRLFKKYKRWYDLFPIWILRKLIWMRRNTIRA